MQIIQNASFVKLYSSDEMMPNWTLSLHQSSLNQLNIIIWQMVAVVNHPNNKLFYVSSHDQFHFTFPAQVVSSQAQDSVNYILLSYYVVYLKSKTIVIFDDFSDHSLQYILSIQPMTQF